VLTVAQVDAAVEAGARFVVSPGFSPAVVARCQTLGVPVFPGVATASEVLRAIDAGLGIVKFFPAEQLGGAAMVRALSAPFGMMRFIPTGGVNAVNLSGYLAISAVWAVGGTWMVDPRLVAAGEWEEITQLSVEAVDLARPR
jgi:2-dehydro-3-deoxyphosphogluconate aldolase/(4S)-4-hydroxy-2-oxoglutarate aldolase